MASLTMDNPLSPSPQIQLKKIVQDVTDCVVEMKRDFEEIGYPITDDSQTLHRLCAKLEFLLQSGFKGKTSIFGDKKDYWNYFCDCIGSTKDLRDGIKFVKSNSELRTSLGRGRAFLRFALVHQRLADTLQQCVCSTKQTNDWYHARAVWLQPALSTTLINALYDLNNIQFDLLPRGYDLDTTWPTFARKTFGSPQSWGAPPSRSVSISSLSSSIPALEIPPSPSLHSIPIEKSTDHVDQLQEELNEAENEKFALQLKVESLSENKRMSSERVVELEAKVEELQKNCSEFEKRCELLTREMQIKDTVWLEKEQCYKSQIEQGEQYLGDVKNKLCKTGASKDALDRAELVTKLAIHKKEMAALRIELKASQLELQCKTQTDAGKTKVIELLDKKIEQLQGQNSRMLTQIEKVSEDRMRDVEGNKSSQQLIEATMDRLKRADAINTELQKANESLRTMLHSMEEKSQKIGNLAKEKMTLYKTENTKLQLDIQMLMKQLAKLKKEGKEGTAEGKESAGEGKEKEGVSSVDDAVLQALDNARKDVDMWKSKYEETTAELEKMRLNTPGVEKQVGEQVTASSKLLEVEKEREEMKKTLDKSREEVKKLLVERMKVDEEVKVVEVKEKEARARHEDLLKALALKETEARRLELDMEQCMAVVEAATEKGQDGPEQQQVEASDDDKPLVVKIKKILRERNQLKHQYQTSDVENISLRKDVETARKKCEDLSKEIMGAQLQIADLKTAVSKAEMSAADMAAKLEEQEVVENSTGETDKVDGEKDELREKLELKEKELKTLEKQIEDEKKVRDGEEVKNVGSSLIEVTQELERMKRKESEVNEEKHSLELKVDELKQRYEDLMEEKVKLEQQRNEIENKLKTTKQTLKKVDKENKKLLAERETLKKEKEWAESQIKELTEDCGKLKTQLVELDENTERIIQDKLVGLQGELQENTKIVEELQSKRMTSAKEHQEEMRMKQEEVEEWRGKWDEQLNQYQGLFGEKKDMESRFQLEQDKLKEDLDIAVCKYEKMGYQLEGESLSIKEAEEMIMTKLKADGKMGEDLGDDLKALAGLLIDDLVDMQVAMSSKGEELDRALQSIESQGKSIAELELTVGNYKTDKENMDAEIAGKDGRLEELQNTVKDSQSQREGLLSELEDFKKDNDKWDREKENLNTEIQAMEEKSSLREEEIESLKGKLSEKTREVDMIQTEQFQKQGDMDSQHTEKVSSLESKLKEKQSEISSLQKSLEEQSTKFKGVQQGLNQEISSLKFELSSQQMEHQEALQGLQGRASNIGELVSKLTAQESLIDMLEKELEMLKKERLLEKNRTMNELEELRQSIRGRDEECRLLNSELKRNELLEVKSEYEHQLRLSRQEVELLKEDTTVLKQQLVKIVKDKDVLWQKTDKLEYLQKLTVSGSWMEDTDTKECLSCKSEFSFLLRKHHCRLCGRIFCYNCCSHWIQSPHSSKKIRICNDCSRLHHLELDRALEEIKDSTQGEEEEEEEEGEGEEVSTPLQHTPSSEANPPTPSPDMDEGKEGGREGRREAGEEEEAPSSFRIDDDDLLGEGNLPGATNTSISSPQNHSDPHKSDDTLRVGEDDQDDWASAIDVPTEKNSKDQSDTEADTENYDVITKEEIVQSIHESVYEVDAQHLSSPMMTVEQIAGGEVEREPDLWIKAGKIYTVPVFIDSPGIVLCWEFSTEPKGIHFSVTFRRDALTSNDLSDVLIPLCPCNSHRQAVQGELIAVQPGLYTLVFDNSTSRFTSKKLTFQLNVKKPEAAD